MVSASVGYQCPDCVRQATKSTKPFRTRFGSVWKVRNTNVTSIVLIAINVAVWLAIMVTGGESSKLVPYISDSLSSLCFTPDMTQYYPALGAAADCAAVGGVFVPGFTDGAFWQPLTSMFTHVSVLHIAFNMLALWFLGPSLERFVGRGKFLAIYLISGLGGSALALWLSSYGTTSYGASGAIFGLMGALMLCAWRAGADIRNLFFWLAMNLLLTFTSSGISWQGHIGGLAVGVGLAALICFAPAGRDREKRQWLGIWAVAALVLVLLVARMFV
ncbi:MAG: rhomboid family intramembrane serine protease [Propionibacteriaceae bacterium]|jgi:membrane associated rhomboid family serine protease|nr:rhomboid family intramembrane serine protease [Propionibacteriaceae bacterium]